jgi:S1-C subfamily serine protease
VVAGALLINVAGDTGPTAIAHARVHPTHDLALLRVPPTGGAALELAPADPEPGDSMLVSGFVHDELSLTVETATVLDYADGAPRGHDGPVMQLDLVVPEGMSGAPVLDDRGRLAGLVYAVEDPPGMTLAIPVSALARAVSRQAQAFLPDTRCG